MPYIIETFDKPGHQAVRQQQRAAHLEYLDANKGLLLACGAKLQDDGADAGGGLYLVDLDTREAAQQFIDADPFAQAGLFERVAITRWRKPTSTASATCKPAARPRGAPCAGRHRRRPASPSRNIHVLCRSQPGPAVLRHRRPRRRARAGAVQFAGHLRRHVGAPGA